MKATRFLPKIAAIGVLMAAGVAVARGPGLRPQPRSTGVKSAIGVSAADHDQGNAIAPNLLPASGASSVLYVDDDAALGGDGLNWSTAFRHLQDALTAASASGGTVSEIRVAQGVYKPDQDEAGNVAPGSRHATFQLIDGVSLLGGHAGIGASNPDERDITAYETVLSGDLLGNDGPDFANNDENGYHVVTGSATYASAIIDGFTVTAGNADGSYPRNCGGGMYVREGRPEVTHCRFTNNAAEYGGGIHNEYNDSWHLEWTISDCVFIGNAGSGVENWDSTLTIANCLFIGNDIGLTNESGWVSVVFASNCTFSGNLDYGVSSWGYSFHGRIWTRLSSCVLWDNAGGGGQIHHTGIGATTVTYSCIQGGWSGPGGEGNIDEDPFFVDPGYWDDNGTPQDPSDDFWVDGDYHLTANSPCIETGDPGFDGQGLVDMDWEARVFNGRVDMGADEYHDCNANGLADYLEIADGTGRDCDGNVVLDECEPGVVPCGGLDVRPGTCPNPLNRSSHGYLPVAVAGTGDFDVTLIVVSSVRLSRVDGIGGLVAPNEGPPGPHSVFEDVATPFGGVPCDCHALSGDGLDDLSMKFSTQAVVAALELGGLTGGDAVELVLAGALLDGTSFTTGSDCVVLVPAGNTAVRARANPPGSAHSGRPQITRQSRP